MNSQTNDLEYPVFKKTSVVDSVKDWIIDQLIKGNLRPGSKLPTEAELCSKMGASRNSIREAIKQLEAYGVVYIKRAEGTFISDSYEAKMLSPLLYSFILQNNRWNDFVDLRRAVDIGTLYVLMTKHLDDEQLLRLKDAFNSLEEAVACRELDVLRITDADCNFHNTIISLTQNPQLITLSEYINLITIPSRQKTTETVINSGEIDSYIHLHRQLYEIVLNSDKGSIEQTVTNHYIFWENATN